MWSRLFIPVRVAFICILTVVLAALYAFLSSAGCNNSFWKRAGVGVLCGAMAWGYIAVSFKLPKASEYNDRITAPLASAPEVPSDVKARLIAFAAQQGIGEGQLFVIGGKRGDTLNANTGGSGADIFFTARLLRELPAEEVVYAAAHEIGHINDSVYRYEENRYMSLATAAFVLLVAFTSWAVLQFDRVRALKKILISASGFLICLIFTNLYLLALPALYNVLSWRSENFADSYAARLLIKDEASRQMAFDTFTRLGTAAPLDPDPPFIIQLMFNDHPSIAERQRNVLSYRIPQEGVGHDDR